MQNVQNQKNKNVDEKKNGNLIIKLDTQRYAYSIQHVLNTKSHTKTKTNSPLKRRNHQII